MCANVDVHIKNGRERALWVGGAEIVTQFVVDKVEDFDYEESYSIWLLSDFWLRFYIPIIKFHFKFFWITFEFLNEFFENELFADKFVKYALFEGF